MSHFHLCLIPDVALDLLYEPTNEQTAEEKQDCVNLIVSEFYDDVMDRWEHRLKLLPIPLQCAISEDFNAGYNAAMVEVQRIITRERGSENDSCIDALDRLSAQRPNLFHPNSSNRTPLERYLSCFE